MRYAYQADPAGRAESRAASMSSASYLGSDIGPGTSLRRRRKERRILAGGRTPLSPGEDRVIRVCTFSLFLPCLSLRSPPPRSPST